MEVPWCGGWTLEVALWSLTTQSMPFYDLHPLSVDKTCDVFLINLLLFSFSVMSDSLWPHGLQHSRLPCPSPTPGDCSNSCPLSRWGHPTLSSSVIPFSSCPLSFSASGSFPMNLCYILIEWQKQQDVQNYWSVVHYVTWKFNVHIAEVPRFLTPVGFE